jgi:hypothetical protein
VYPPPFDPTVVHISTDDAVPEDEREVSVHRLFPAITRDPNLRCWCSASG